MNNETIQIKKDSVLSVYQTAYETGDTDTMLALETLFGEEIFNPKDVTNRIKTFEDALYELGKTHPLVKDYRLLMMDTKFVPNTKHVSKDVIAYLKLRIITAALNEGWEPKFTKDEMRYFPCFYVYGKEELEQMNDEQISRVVIYTSKDEFMHAGISFATADYASPNSITICGGRFFFKSSKLAIYCGKQFIDLWKDYLII